PDFSWLGLIVEGKCFLGSLVELIQKTAYVKSIILHANIIFAEGLLVFAAREFKNPGL
ncbi:2580_t:CDS:2, partial [Dentiscutata heterogama]